MRANKASLSMEEIDSEISRIQARLNEILKLPQYNPKNAADFEALENTLQSLGRELADLIAAKKNKQLSGGAGDKS